MKPAFGYIRVSDQKQLQGVSLQEQKDAIAVYAQRNGLEIVEWFEEQQTAAKTGRVLFDAMMKKLKTSDKVKTVVLHKVDRGARNFKDWADLVDLVDLKGVKMHFAHESINMNERSGRLMGSILAALATDYIQNLKDETKKGLYGRLKEGIYPFQAPLGYLDTGAGNPKTIDPVKGPVIKELFEMYATGKFSYEFLLGHAKNRGLISTKGKSLGLNGLSTIFQNPFYIGLMLIKGQTFQGKHKPLVSPTVFSRVQQVRTAKALKGDRKHTYLFSRSIRCQGCGHSLVAERQKGLVYYRCHSSKCSGTSFREETIEATLLAELGKVVLPDNILQEVHNINAHKRISEHEEHQELVRGLQLQLENNEQRLSRLTDALIDGVIDKTAFNLRNQQLLTEKQNLDYRLEQLQKNRHAVTDLVDFYLERLKCLKTTYLAGIREERLDFAKSMTSNFQAIGKSLSISLKSPFSELGFGETFDRVPQSEGSLEPILSEGQLKKKTQQCYKVLYELAQRATQMTDPLKDKAN